MKKIISPKWFFAVFCIVTTTILSAQNVLKVTSGAVIKTTGGAVITLQNMDLDNDGTISQAPGEGVFRFTGTQNNTISGTSAPLFDIVEIAKTGSAKISFQRTINIGSAINFTSGLIDLNNNNLFLQPAALLNGESELSCIIGPNGGYIEISNTLNAPSSANPGNLGAILTSSQNLGNTVIRRGHKAQVNGFGMGSSILRYYDILPTNNTALNATLRFQYLDAELNGLNENSIVLWKSPDNTHWNNQGFTTRNTVSNYVEKIGIADFSRWTLSSPANALPVTGLILSGRWRNNAAYLDWTTLAEYSNDHFNIERKYPDENYFITVGSKNSVYVDGNSQAPTGYNYIDLSAVANRGPIQYRLKQIDRNGQFAYSNIILLKPGGPLVFIEKIFPTVAVKNMLYIQVGNLYLQDIQVQVVDMLGRLLLNQQSEYQSQWLTLPPLSTGMYRLVIRSGEWQYTESFMK